METMLEIARDFLSNGDDKSATFKKIWAEVLKVKKEQWKKDSPKVLVKEIESQKRAELYTLLTVSGEFVKTATDDFALIKNFTFEEVKKMKINVGEEL